MSSGTSDADFEKIQQILDAIKDIHTICLDVANGYSEHFVNYVRKVRARFPQHTIIAGNVVTGMFFFHFMVFDLVNFLKKSKRRNGRRIDTFRC